MKHVGLTLIAIGLAVLIFGLYSYIKTSRKIISPVPETGGIKVMYITPGVSPEK